MSGFQIFQPEGSRLWAIKAGYYSPKLNAAARSVPGTRWDTSLKAHVGYIDAIEHDTPTNCNVALARDAEEVAHALAIAAQEGKTVSLPLADRTHAFANMKAGVKSLKEEVGRAVPAKR